MTERELLRRISINPQMCSGVPCIKGHRIMVHQILGLLGSGVTPQDICSKWFPSLELEDVYACVVFANQLVRDEEIHFFEELSTGK